ncbi:GNAT family acetyltransferase [Legionella busanensis]|uniref:GNAT family acetyltransferase n=1 Tax=Legionella busanensis TaxID=190655 RepID=A0A378JIB4_9GAMM|nr:GNAT family N-acetyltransferase [Legionella busanensis]STX51056.1 GNAT family acetyltransferase [Legionella busanensis]
MQTKITVRPYQEVDAPALAAIYYNTIHQVNSRDYSSEQINAWAPELSLQAERWKPKWKSIIPLVAICDEKAVGFAEFEPTGHIDCFYVHHSYQGQGAGKALMFEIEDKAKQEQIPRLYAEVSITAKPFFEKCGFVVVKQQQVLIRGYELTNYRMEKRLIYDQVIIHELKDEKIPDIVKAFKESNWTLKSSLLFKQYLQEQQQQKRLIWLAYYGDYFAGYITLKWQSNYPFFQENKIPEIMDLNVLPKFRQLGIGSLLLNKAEEKSIIKSSYVGIGVGLYADYGAAQQLYIKRGYIPDGRGTTFNYKATLPGESYPVDDDLILWLTKKLR